MNLQPGKVGEGKAFTLIELLVVIGIIVVLTAIALPLLGRTKQQADVVQTMSNMKQVGVALLSYANDNSYQLPNRVLDGANDDKWPRLLLPYLQDTKVYSSPIPDVQGKSYRVSQPSDYLNNAQNYTCYIYNGMNDVGAHNDAAVTVRLNNLSNPTQTILLGIPYPRLNNFYMDFDDGDNNVVLNKKAFPAGSIYMFCDGSSRVLAYNNDSVTYKTQRPPGSGTYTDWLWLFDKDNSAKIH